jgi:hypothetical protein
MSFVKPLPTRTHGRPYEKKRGGKKREYFFKRRGTHRGNTCSNGSRMCSFNACSFAFEKDFFEEKKSVVVCVVWCCIKKYVCVCVCVCVCVAGE